MLNSFSCTPTKKFFCIDVNYDFGDRGGIGGEENLVFIDIVCKYTSKILNLVVKRRNSTTIIKNIEEYITDGSHSIYQFCDFELIEWDPVLSGQHFASSYLIRKGLSRKAQMASQIKKYNCKNPLSILTKSVPFTIILDTWDAFEETKMNFGFGITTNFDAGVLSSIPLRQRLEWCLEHEYLAMTHESRKDWLWILKPSVTNKGMDISIVKYWPELLTIMETMTDIREWVLQRYIDEPLLVNGTKSHLRVYVLCTGALKVFVFGHILMLFAAHTYDVDNREDLLCHLTNTARGAEDVSFNEETGVQLLDDLASHLACGRTNCTVQSAVSSPSGAKSAVQLIRDQICDITSALFSSFENEYTVFSPMSNCFELFGLDFLVDDALSVHFLEANPGPDFKQTGDRLHHVIVRLLDDTCRLVLDHDILRSDGDSRDHEGDFVKVYDKRWSAASIKGGMKIS